MARDGDDFRPGRRPGLALGFVLAFLTAGCQTAMSVEEARTVAASFSGAPLALPPRSINDVLAVLDAPETGPRASGARELADAPPPATADRAVLAHFYFQRGLAAQKIGRAGQELDDLTQALEHAEGGIPLHTLLMELGYAELRSGNLSRSLRYRRRAIQAVPPSDRGPLVNLHASLAVIHAGLGDLGAADAALAEASWVFHESLGWTGQIPRWTVGREVHMAQAQASVLEARGAYAEAEPLYRKAARLLAGEPFWAQDFFLDVAHYLLARNLVLQGRLVEAEAEARRAVRGAVAKHGRDSPHTAWMLRSLVSAVLEQGRYRDAEQLARTALAIQDRTQVVRDSFVRARLRGHLARALELQGRDAEALAEYETIRRELAGDPEYLERYFRGHVGYAAVLTNTGHGDHALDVLRAAREGDGGVFGELRAGPGEVQGHLARAHAARGDLTQALRLFRAATPLLLRRPASIDEEANSPRAADHRLAGILGAYIGLLADIKGTALERAAGIDATAEAFRLADAARGRSVQRALGASAARAAAGTPALAALTRNLQDARRRLAAHRVLLANAVGQASGGRDPETIADLSARVETLKRAVEALTAQIGRDFPAYAELIDPKPLTVDEVRAMLAPDEALLATLVTGDRTFVWAVPGRGAVAFAPVPIGARALEGSIATLRRALAPSAARLGDIPEFDVDLAYRLFSQLLEPVRPGWEHARSLIVVPHGPLGQLPFALLPTRPVSLPAESALLFARYRGVPWLVRTHAVTALPSVASLATLRALPPAGTTRRPFVGFGDPYFAREQAALAAAVAASPSQDADVVTHVRPITLRGSPPRFDSSRLATLPRLAETAEEIRSLARVMGADPTRDVFLGVRANERVVKSLDLSRYRVVAFATHGLVPGDLDGLTQPALALSAPDVAGVDGDGLLTMDEVLALRLDADWVVLSACNTASGESAGAEAISGLGRAFFYAGARALLVSNWPVETTSARALTTELFRRQGESPGLDRARALQQTLTWLIDHGELVDPASGTVVSSYAHPIFWAPFTLIGDGGGERPAP